MRLPTYLLILGITGAARPSHSRSVVSTDLALAYSIGTHTESPTHQYQGRRLNGLVPEDLILLFIVRNVRRNQLLYCETKMI